MFKYLKTNIIYNNNLIKTPYWGKEELSSKKDNIKKNDKNPSLKKVSTNLKVWNHD